MSQPSTLATAAIDPADIHVSSLPDSPEALAEAVQVIGQKVVEQLRTVFDPEIPVNIYDLGLIYKLDIAPAGPDAEGKYNLLIDMTLTTPNCPVAGTMPGLVERAASNVDELHDVKVNLTFDPPWDKARMSDEARLHLNMF
jgi:FeS assembly SUF system protein